jgi:hypothetical protein
MGLLYLFTFEQEMWQNIFRNKVSEKKETRLVLYTHISRDF